MHRLMALLPLALLAACGQTSGGGPSPEEQRELNEAAAALDANDASPAGQPGVAAGVTDASESNDQGTAQ